MDYLDIDEEINRIRITDDWGKAVEIVEMADTFSDLRLFRDHLGRLRFSSPDANTEVDQLDVFRDQVLSVGLWVALDEKQTRLYSYPPVFEVADQNRRGFGYVPRPGWRETLEQAGFDRSVILKVKDLLDRQPPVNYWDDDGQPGTGDPGAGR